MASFISDYTYTINTGKTYIFRGYVYSDILTKIEVLGEDYTPISSVEQKSYTLTTDEAKTIYDGIMSNSP